MAASGRGGARRAGPGRRRTSSSSTSRCRGWTGSSCSAGLEELAPDATIIIMTAYASVETAVQALKEGAYDYVVKPFDPEEVSRLVRKAAERYSLLAENRALRERIEAAAPHLITAGTAGDGARCCSSSTQVAPTDTQRADHRRERHRQGAGGAADPRPHSARRFGPFVVVNCGALAEGVLESELFGHEKGAFTGAAGAPPRQGRARPRGHALPRRDRRRLAQAPGRPAAGPAGAQSITRVGGTAPIPVDFRLITATHRDLEAEVRGRALPRGLLLPHQRVPPRRCRRCASAPRTSRCSPRTSSSASRTR